MLEGGGEKGGGWVRVIRVIRGLYSDVTTRGCGRVTMESAQWDVANVLTLAAVRQFSSIVRSVKQ
jgi:hypothetical protein